MEENLSQEQISIEKANVPETEIPENSLPNQEKTQIAQDKAGQSKTGSNPADDPANLILGKFKSVDDLTKAYQELEKSRGLQSEELGQLRQNSVLLNNIKKAWDQEQQIREAENDLKAVSEKYNTPEYFQDPSFRELYKEAYLALGKNLDAERFVNLIEGYVSSRIFALENSKAKQSETSKALNSVSFEKNSKSSITPPKKRLDEMTQDEVNELIDRLI